PSATRCCARRAGSRPDAEASRSRGWPVASMLRDILNRLVPAKDPSAPRARPAASPTGESDRLIAEGNQAEKDGRLNEACRLYGEAVKAAPGYARAHLNLGIGLEAVGDADGAAKSYETALACDPGNAYANYNLGKMLYSRGALARAEQLLLAALEGKPVFPEARVVLGGIYESQGRLDAARDALEIALKERADVAGVWYNYAGVLRKLERPVDVIAAYREALALTPDHTEAHYDLGVALRNQGQYEEAAACFERVLDLKPGLAQAHYCLGQIFDDQDRHDESLASFRKAMSLDPEYALARWAYTMSQLPAVYGAQADQERCRAEFSSELEGLDRWSTAARSPVAFEVVGTHQPFRLAYQELNNRELLQQHGRLCARLMAEWFNSQAFAASGRDGPDGIIRVGIVSRYFRNHSVWHAIVKGWFQQLDRARFSLHVFHTGTEHDQETDFARSRAASFDSGQGTLRQWVDAVKGQRPDVLLYPEIGMDPVTTRLASLRLAPVQVATWGHPETTGLPTIDYYLSAQDLEPPEAQDGYTEQLVALPHLGCYYEPAPIATVDADLGSLRPDANGPLLICPGMPFKYAPQYDSLITRIARRLGRCRFVFFESQPESRCEKLRRRLEAAFDRSRLAFHDFVTFMPWQLRPQFHALLKHADVFLDTVGFSGFNTAVQAVQCGLPIVTIDGRFMRGRLASGILRRMGLADLIAGSEEEYVERAVRLAQDTEFRAHVRERIAASRHALFSDSVPIRALEEFLVKATAQREASPLPGR
ncbi:MAG: tetratricopeptide repeat protein, partial [Burkholderiales bacterium]